MKKTMFYKNNVRALGHRLLSLAILFILPLSAWADEIPIRYVKTYENGGRYGNDALSWSTATDDVQEAIEDLYSYMTKNQLREGRVYVAAGTYYPSRSTETGNDNRQHLSFLIRPGVHVYGGFAADETNDHVDPDSETDRPHTELHSLGTTNSQEGIKQPWNFVNKTILSGNLIDGKEPDITYDDTRGSYKTIFYGNSYHVVWFATNGFIDATSDENYGWDETGLSGHARELPQPASIDGCTITGGYAATKSNSGHPHTAYGAGAYMVEGASLVNCVVEKCLAMVNGGGVYMDGGGLVDKCFIHTCQATGQSALQGFGGGVCINFDGAVTRSYIANNSSRSGGGVAILHLQKEYPWHSRAKEEGVPAQQINRMEINVYSPHATACIISNNSSTNEAAGIYLNNGGVVNHLTITNNRCFGNDVTYYGRRQGRSGGIYILNGGQVYNTVVWGNKCQVNGDIQYACHTSGSTETLKPQVYYSAFDKHETTDWSGTTQTNVYSLESTNTNGAGNNALYPYFIGTDGQGTVATDIGAGLSTDDIPRPISWKPAAISGLAEKGVQVTDALSGASDWIKHAHTDTDLLGYEYEPVSSLGALVRREEKIRSSLIKNQEKEIYREAGYTSLDYTGAIGHADSPKAFLPDNGSNEVIPTIFVDPLRKLTEKNGNAVTPVINIGQEGLGSNWTTPCAHINDAIHYFRRCLVKDENGKIVYDENGDVTYRVPTAWNNDGAVTTYTDFKHVQILVKGAEGTAVTTTAGLDAYLGEELRTAAIRPCSNMRIYGGYPADLTETNTGRSKLRGHRTRVTANVINSGYQNNSAHVFALSNVKNVIIDGFEIFYGNANLNSDQSYAPIDPVTGQREAIAYGGGLILNNSSALQEDRIDMTGNILRNSVIAHCSAPDGAAVYVNGGNKKGDDTYCRAELNIINTIIRNNTVGDGTDVTQGEGGGIVSARGSLAKVRLDHCDLVNNCGYPMETLSAGDGGEGYIYIYNSVIYANGKELRSNRKNIVQPLCYNGSADHFDYDYIHLDWDARTPVSPTENVKKIYCRDLSEHYQKWGIRRVDANDKTLLDSIGNAYKQFFDTEAAANTYKTEHAGEGWTEPIYLQYPFFVNPAKNVGHSEEGDKPMNGGSIDYMPQATNPMVNDASDISRTLWDGDNNPRNYGGDPDIGALESTDLPVGGSVIYVTPDGAGRRDGSSWDNAIAGNTVYVLDGVEGPELATGDQIDPESTCDRILDSEGNPILTTDKKYCGGFGKVYMTGKETGAETTTTATETWKKVYRQYTGGDYDSQTVLIYEDEEAPSEVEENTVITTAGSTPDGFTPGYQYDPRYPYGEISGASRSFWRANPYHDGTDWNNAADYANVSAFITAANTNGWINNNRQEKYVSGLQYAVEKAAAYNALPENDNGRVPGVESVQVWISNGTYTDYKGYVMRDKTTVMGSFPAVKDGKTLTPSLNERQALMSDVVNIPKSKQAVDFDAVDYETILQISDVDPKIDNETLNTAAVNAWDDDLDIIVSNDTRTSTRIDKTITEYYSWAAQEDVSTTYILYPDMLYQAPNTNVFSQRHKTGKVNSNYTESEGETVGGIKWASGKHYVPQYFGNKRNSDGNQSWELVYEDRTNNVSYSSFRFDSSRDVVDASGTKIGTVPRGMELSGVMNTMSVWQTMKNVPAGTYNLQVDLGAYYTKYTSETNTGITFYVIDSEGTTRASQTIYCASDKKLRRYTFDNLEQPATGDFTIRIMAAPGTKATDPETGNFATSSNNWRKVSMANVQLSHNLDKPVYVKDDETESSVETPSDPVISPSKTSAIASTHRTTLRKRVLTMPDVCVPTYGAGSVGDPATGRGKFTDNLCHTDRVKQESVAYSKRTSSTLTKRPDPNYVDYTDVYWDGFTIRHGFIADEGMGHGGGAGVNIYEGAHLQNCIVINNIVYSERVKGGGLFCDGATSTVENCFILNNTSTHGTYNKEPHQIFAGGMFMYEGTCFNSLFAKNYSHGSGGGLGLCVGRFFNNTVAYNECGNISDKSEGYAGGGVAIATGAQSNLFMANTIIYGNNGTAIRERNYTSGITEAMVNPFIHCFIQSEDEMTSPAFLNNIKNNAEDATCYGIGNTFTSLNGVAANRENSPFAADKESFGKAKETNDFRLASSTTDCVNAGTTAFAETILQALLYKGGKTKDQIMASDFYKNVEAVEIPDNDVVFAPREQDCQIDIGAYEYDAAMSIRPAYEMIDFADENGTVAKELCAVYYVTQNGNSAGDSSGSSPENAACATKLQHVLDAAGRLKYDLKIGSREFSTDVIDLSVQVQPLEEHTYTENSTIKVKQIKHGQSLDSEGNVTGTPTDMSLTGENGVKHVIVKLADGVYMPDRSTNNSMVTGESEDEILTHSLIIPHGVEVWGGYQFKNDSDDPTDFFEYTRDVLNHKSIFLSGVENSSTGSIGKAYHVVSFSNHLYDPITGEIYNRDGLQGENKLKDIFSSNPEQNRAILDGLYIQEGEANGVNEEDKYGGAGVVPDYAHIRNCIIKDNMATKQGGALYLLPGALVSGCIFKDNTADQGGAIYVVEPTEDEYASYTPELRDKAYARVYNTTIINNTANMKGGGIFFDTNIRAKGVVLWQNTANDMNNVAGTFDSEAIQEQQNYPLSYCAVQNRRLPGVNNKEVAGESDLGVRWNSSDVIYWKGESTTDDVITIQDGKYEYKDFNGFYYIDRVSALVRQGMPYVMYNELRKTYVSLELADLAGVYRMDYSTTTKGADYKNYFGESNELVTKNNKYMEIGARALNTQMDLDVESSNCHMTRLFVAKSEDINSTNANILLSSGDPLYSQQGSSMPNPFTKFSDAIDYIVKLRNYKNTLTTVDEGYAEALAIRQKYANTRFEIFVAGGEYYPYQNVRGMEGNARSSTFVLPEGVTIIGGLRPNRMYCQAGYDFTNQHVPDGEETDKDENDRTEIHNDRGDVISNPGITLVEMETDDIREARLRTDINENSVFEPWEFEKESIFSGNTPRGNENEDNVFHVFTCLADANYVGTLPTRYSDKSCSAVWSGSSGSESDESLRRRMIILDGVTVKEGNARDYEDGTVRNIKMFYRGGGIMVDGSWDNATVDSPQSNADDMGARDIPLIISSCLFQNNNAIQGGAIFTNGTLNVFSSSFVQNYACGPISNDKLSPDDRATALATIQYVGGGAIATTNDLLCVNTIFANNEAMLGDTRNLLNLDNTIGYEQQGFGGVIWGGSNSNVKLLNCNLVNNQAVSYPGVYLVSPNTTGNMHHFGVNTVFWGNKATGVPSNLSRYFSRIIDINDDVVKFRDHALKITNEDPANVETLYFCAYEEGKGPKDMKASENITYNGTEYEPHAIPFTDKEHIRESFKIGDTYYNNNVIITSENEGVDGPNFLRPSSGPGRDGFSADANWMASRVNKLTDNGWSYLTVAPDASKDDEMGFKVEFGGQKAFKVRPDDVNSGGVFNWNSYNINDRFHLNLMPLGSIDLSDSDHPQNYYMKFNGTGMTDQMATGGQSYMQRISSNPLSRDEYEAYIDIGVYEYQHRTLKINQGSEIDVIWITDTENPEVGNDGYSWETATSNVQVAIETLLKSRNNHGKRLNIIAGSYKPMTVINDNLGYTLQTSAYNDGVYTPFINDENKGEDDADPYGVKYIHLRGGYDKEVPDENGFDYQKNQVVFSMEQRTGVKEDALNHIVNIADIEQFTTKVWPDRWDYDENMDLVPVHFSKKSENTGRAIPVIIEGITFENTLAQAESETNPGGAAISYKAQYRHVPVTDEETDEPIENKYEIDNTQTLGAPEDGSPKLTIRNCTFAQNGKDVSGTPASAIRIEEGGGDALIVNSVFHSNKGNPVDAVNTVVLNCTSAMNGGHITLSGADSELHNSVIWQDDQRADDDTKKHFEVPAGMCTYSGSTPVMTDKMTYNAISGLPKGVDAKHNEPLSDTNNDLEEGPNFLFMNPNDEDPTKRDFRIRPSLKLLDRGDNETYARFVWPTYPNSDDYLKLMSNTHDDQTILQENLTTIIREGNETREIHYSALKCEKDLDRAFNTRLLNDKIDRGAYECTGRGQRVIYVNPEKFGSGLESGSTWEDALGRGNLQRAIDAAAVYVRNHGSSEDSKAYVFVRGDNVYNEGEITIRDGVSVYGTAPIAIMAIPKNPTANIKEELYEYTENELKAYVNRVKAERSGIAFKSLKAESYTPTYCSGLVSMGDYKLGSVFDGLLINNGVDNVSDYPVVNIAKDAKVAIQNCIIIHNSVSNDKEGNPQPVVNLAGGLLYNSLIYDGHGGDMVKVGENGYVLNCTVIADGSRQKAVTYGGATGSYDDHVKNTIAVNGGGSQIMFAPYMHEGANAYTPASYLTTHRPYWYQLHEKSKMIDNASISTNAAVSSWLPEQQTTVTEINGDVTYHINYNIDIEHDRDLLGNPRVINGTVDDGCFETWLVKNNTALTTETRTNAKGNEETYVTDEDNNNYYINNFGGRFYPHPGSVVYIENGARLMLGKIGDDPMFSENNPWLPGYLLIEEGGSLYGQGNHVTAHYVAVDRSLSGQYALISVPYRCDPNSTVAISYDEDEGKVTESRPVGLTGSTYDGEQRSRWDYHYKVEDSDCWIPQSDFVPANMGWLMSLGAAPDETTIFRFTGWSESETSYIYTEDGSDKAVTLTQYNDLPDDGSAHFTKEENMGWNMTGLPWLVSNYATNTLSGGTYQMNVPHVFYSNLDKRLSDRATGNYTDGQFYATQSWVDGVLSPGVGFFTQTAVLDETEDLTFKLPVYAAPSHARACQRIGISAQSGNTTRGTAHVRFDDVVDVYPQADADAAMSYRLGADGIKWMAFNQSIAQIYVENAVGTRLSLVSAAPVETEISLGVKAPEAGDYVISLPEPEAYSDYEAVWVIDDMTGASANLLAENFILSVHQAGDFTNRLKLKFGGMRPEAQSEAALRGVIKVAARHGRLPMPTIADHEMIRIYNPTGALIFTGPASDSHNLWLPDGVYIIQRDL